MTDPVANIFETSENSALANQGWESCDVTLINGGQCRMARAALKISVRDLAAKARVGVNTIVRFEGGEKLQDRTIDAIRIALEKGGVEFNEDGRGVRLKPRRR
jgi:hypothetical protein